MSNDKKIEMKAVIKGKVQGVGFRMIVKKHADSLSIPGFVQNLDNGDVEICAQGSKKDLELLMNKVKKNPGMGRVDKVSVLFEDPKNPYSSFEIKI